jgi:hypothetical protein
MKKNIIACILSVFSLFLTGCGINLTNGSGEKVGQIVKVNKQGFINKTWEAELIRGGMNAGSGSFGTTPFNFTIESEDAAHKIEGYMRNQTEVLIRYEIRGIYSAFGSDSSGHYLVSIEPLTNSIPSTSKR